MIHLSTVLNVVALLGWTVVAVMTALEWNGPSRPSQQLLNLTLACECICASEVVRIALGMLRGDLALAITVHYTRLLMWFVTLPHPEVTPFVVKLILVAWAATEVARYPMVLFPSSAPLKTFRYATPLVTFPMGAGTEAFAAYTVAQVTPSTPLYVALTLVVLVNVIGGIVWYPSMIAKVTRSLSPKAQKDKKAL